MGPPSRSIHSIFPLEDRTNPAEDGTQAEMDGVTLAHPIRGQPAKKRRRYNSRKTTAEWDLIKADLKRLYVDEDRSLEETIAELQANHGFEASKDQFKSKIKVWDFDKKIKTQEMKHIVRVDNKRLPKKTSFTVRKQPVSRFKIERFKKGHAAFPEPPSSTPSLNLTVSPRLGHLDWYRSYEEHHNQAPEYSLHPGFEILQILQIRDNICLPQMFSKSQFTWATMWLKEASSVNSPESKKDYFGCVLREVEALYLFRRATHENDPDSLSADPILLPRWKSEVLGLYPHTVDAVGISMTADDLDSFLWDGTDVPANVSCEVGLELCRAAKSKNWCSMLIALHLLDHLILRGRVLAGKALLRAIMKQDFDTIDVPSRISEGDSQWDDEPMRLLYWRRATTQLAVIRWLLEHPKIKYEVFGSNGTPKHSFTTCGGLQVNHSHFCFAGLCPDQPEFLSGGQNLTEGDKITRDLIDGLQFTETDRLRMRAVLGLSWYLPRYGHSMRFSAAAQALDSEMQEEVGEKDENGIKDQGGIPFNGLQFGEYHPDEEQDERSWWIAGSQEAPIADYEGSSSTFDGYHRRPPASGYVLEMEDLPLGEEMRIDNEPFDDQWGDPFRNDPTSTGQWTDFSSEQADQAGSMPVQTQFTPWLSANSLIDPPESMSTFPELQHTEPMPNQDLNEEQTRMDTDPDLELGTSR
ncbi:MAG: hypothetical protein Q9184_007103 [Pyrenodesmia sp. 2 TL-2023]